MKKNIIISQNYLERIPKRADLEWSADEQGIVTVVVQNKGWVNKIAQIFFKRPKQSYIHLDENGSFVWLMIDGKKDIIAIGKDVEARFGEKANPLYERLAQFFRIMENYKFIEWEFIPDAKQK